MVRSLPLIALLITSSCAFGWREPAVWLDDEQTLSIEPEAASSLHCETHNGFVAVSGTGSAAIDVRVYRRGGGRDAADARACLQAIRVFSRREGDTVRLGWEWAEPRDRDWVGIVSFDVRQPAGLSLAAQTHNGEIRVRDLSGGSDLSTHNGDITAQECAGPVSAETHNGDIGLRRCRGVVALQTHNGRVRAELTDGHVSGSIETHNGSVQVKLAEATNTRIVCATHNGGVSAGVSGDLIAAGRNFLVMDRGTPRDQLRIETHNGSISVR